MFRRIKNSYVYIFLPALAALLLQPAAMVRAATFTDNFNDNNLAGWVIGTTDWDLMPTVSNGEVHFYYTSTSAKTCALLTPVGAVSDFTFEAKGTSKGMGGCDAAGIFGVSAEGNYIEYHILPHGSDSADIELIAGNIHDHPHYTTHFKKKVPCPGDNWIPMKIAVSGIAPTLNVVLHYNGTQVYSGQITDVPATERYGHIGVFVYGTNVDMWFDDVNVEEIGTQQRLTTGQQKPQAALVYNLV